MSTKGKALTPVLVTLFLIVVTGAATSASRLALAPGDAVPEMRGNRADGSHLKVDYGSNKVTLINFWATWCVPCREEMPVLQELWDKHRDQGLEVVGAFHDAAPLEKMREFTEALGVTYTVIRPRDKVTPRWGGAAILPLTYLIDSDGRLLRRYLGATPQQLEALTQDVAAVLRGEPLGPVIVPDEPAIADDEDRQQALDAPER